MHNERKLNIHIIDTNTKIHFHEVKLKKIDSEILRFTINFKDTKSFEKIIEIPPLKKEIFFVEGFDVSWINNNFKRIITENSILFGITICSKKIANTSTLIHIENIRIRPIINTTKKIELKINEINY